MLPTGTAVPSKVLIVINVHLNISAQLHLNEPVHLSFNQVHTSGPNEIPHIYEILDLLAFFSLGGLAEHRSLYIVNHRQMLNPGLSTIIKHVLKGKCS